jgi:hypothetical protein
MMSVSFAKNFKQLEIDLPKSESGVSEFTPDIQISIKENEKFYLDKKETNLSELSQFASNKKFQVKYWRLRLMILPSFMITIPPTIFASTVMSRIASLFTFSLIQSERKSINVIGGLKAKVTNMTGSDEKMFLRSVSFSFSFFSLLLLLIVR